MTINPIEWSESYSVGHDDIDSQHLRLIELINLLALEIGADSTERVRIELVLNSLTQYTVYHFSYEELIFCDSGHPDHLVHKEMHRKFIDKILKYRDDFESGRSVDLRGLYDFLKRWLLNHICVADKEMFDWIDSRYPI